MKNHFQKYTSDRKKICRLCGEKINGGEECVAIRQLSLPARFFDLYFHQNCFWNNIKELEMRQ